MWGRVAWATELLPLGAYSQVGSGFCEQWRAEAFFGFYLYTLNT